MLRKFYVSILCLFFTFITLAQEKIWEIEGNNKSGKAIINLPNNAGYLVASQDQVFNFNPSTSKNYWAPVTLQDWITAMCKADSNHVFIVGQDDNKACVKKLNYKSADIVSTKKHTELGSVFTAIHALPNGTAVACGYLNDSLGGTRALIADVNNDGSFSLVTLPDFINLNSQATAVTVKGNQTYIAGKFSAGLDSIWVWEKGTANYKVFLSKGTDPIVNFLAVAADNSIFLGYQHTTNFLDYSQELVKLNANLGIEKSIPAFANLYAAIALKDSTIACTGNVGGQLLVAKLDKNLTPIWTKNLGFAPHNIGFSIDTTTANGFIMVGETGASATDVDVIIIRTTTTAPIIIKNQIVGQVKGGLTCGAATAIPLSGFPVQGKINGKTHFGLTDNQGIYSITTDTIGPIEIQAVNILGSGYQNCIPVIDTIWANGVIRTAPTFYVQDASSTPRLRVDLSTDILVPNDTSTYSLYVKNTRSVAINNVYAKVNFDLALKPIAPILNDSIFIGTLAGNEEKRIPIKRKFEPSTPFFPNKTYCTSANIFPNNSNWNGPRLKVTAECDIPNQRIKVTVKNNGTGALVSKTGGVIVDDVILKTIFINNLPDGLDTILFVNIGKVFNTFIAVMNQGGNNPYGNFVSDRGENCNNTNVFLPQTTYSDYDDDPTYAIECLTATTTTTAASKNIVFPLGLKLNSKEHILTQDSTTFEYHTIVQNTGNDTSKNIVLEHSFSINLTLDKIELGASSHPFTARVDSNKLILTVPNIDLVPSSLDSRKSIAFFNFRLKLPQKNNEAEVFTTETGVRFGYNSAVIPIDNITRVIKKLKITAISINTLQKDLPSIKVAPNPMQSSAQISGAEEWVGAIFNVFDLQGRLVLQIPIRQPTFQLDADHLSQGLFFCKIEYKGRVVANGKIVVQE